MSAQDIERAAAGWLVRMECAEDPALQEDFQAWLQASSRHRATFLRLQHCWRRADRLQRLRPLDGRVDLAVIDHFCEAAPLPRVRALRRHGS